MKYSLALVLFFLMSITESGAQLTKLNQLYPTANEPTIAISKKDPNIWVASSNLNLIYYSEDAGHSWNSYHLKSSLGFYGDPVLHAAKNGDFYLVHLSRTKGKKWGAWFDRIVFQKSSDGGKTFTDGVGIGYNLDRTQDKPWLSTDTKGNLYLTWTEFDKYGSDSANHYSKIMFSKSADGGDTWSKPIVVSDEMGGCKDDDNTLEGANVAVNSKGVVFVSWAGKEKIYFDKSTDGGITFGEDRVVAEQKGGWVLDIPHLYRTNGMPFLQVDQSGLKAADHLYLAFTSKVDGKNRVVFMKSYDDGETWRNRDKFGPNVKGDQFFPNLSVDPLTGYIILGFYDAPAKYSYNYANYYVATAGDGGHFFRTKKMNHSPFPLPNSEVFFGDYSDVDVSGVKNAAIFATYTSPVKGKKGGMNILVAGNDKDIIHKEAKFQYIYRKDHLSILIPPNSNLKLRHKILYGINRAKQPKLKKTYVNSSKTDWKEIKISTEVGVGGKAKYRLKSLDKGSEKWKTERGKF